MRSARRIVGAIHPANRKCRAGIVQASDNTGAAPATYATVPVALSLLRLIDAGAAPAHLADINPCAASSARAA